ncbi:alpha/beta hydrolase [uncultured Cellulomonas sp.]|uniref:alpha/beta hydrolase n=1 Tax=uncultured Cellulomonas sp. TaxID=189682 RepID=UPI002606E821|nr:alpha/beta hydrolase fold domain-containing protein [uncultured Cellulomonas sp.]
MPIDPFFVRRFPMLDGIDLATDAARSPEQDARLAAYRSHPHPYTVPDTVAVSPLTIPGPHGPVAARLLRPRDAAPSEATAHARGPGVLWLHGGGFAGGSLDAPEAHVVGAELARRAGAVVLTVGYRLAVGGVRHPVPLDDVAAAWDWLVAAAGDLGIDPTRMSIGGTSAGGNLAAAACLRARDRGTARPARMLLAYPALHFPTPALPDAVLAQMREVPVLHRFTDRWESIVRTYVGRLTDVPHEAMPGHADLTGLPPALVVVAEHDDLRPSGELFARQLLDSGGEATTYLAAGMLHGHLNREPTPELPEVDRTIDVLADALRRPVRAPVR